MKNRAFSLLEVMVAVAILGFSLTAILSAQAGLFSAGSHAQRESLAIGLVRCKMADLEERMLRLGYPEVDTKDDGPCCDPSQGNEGMKCYWEILRVELPTPTTFGDTLSGGDAGSLLSALGASSSGGLGSLTGGLGSMPGSPGAMGAYGGGSMPQLPNGAGALGALMQAGANDAGALLAAGGADGGVGALASMMGGATSTGVAGLAPLVMNIVYPSLKPMLEASIRKVTVKVEWREGLRSRDLKITQYLTNPMRGGFMGSPYGSASGMPGMPGAPGQFGPSGGTTATPPTKLPSLGGALGGGL